MSSVSSLKYHCPVTKREVQTSIQTDDVTLGAMHRMELSLWCPHCKNSHRVKGSEAFVDFAARAWVLA